MFYFQGPDSTGHYLQPAVHGAGDGAAGGRLLVVVESLLDTVSRAIESGDSINPFGGIEALGTNWHPLIVHFPIAFLTGFFLLELIGVVLKRPGLRDAASWMLYLGALAAIAAATAGLIAANTVPHGSGVHEIMEWHERLGLTIAGLSSVLAMWRLLGKERISAMAEALHLFLGAILVVAIVFAADLGGLMVYQHGVGVKSLQLADDHHHHGGHEHSRANSDRVWNSQRTMQSAEPAGESGSSAVEPDSHGAPDTADLPHSHEALGADSKLHSHKDSHLHGKPNSHKPSDAETKPRSHGVAGTRKESQAKP